MKSIYETLAALGAGVLLAGCGASPVNSTEVPAATEAKPMTGSMTPPAEIKPPDPAAAALPGTIATAAPTSTAKAAAPPPGSGTAKAGAPKKPGTATNKKKKDGAAGDCGEGTCA